MDDRFPMLALHAPRQRRLWDVTRLTSTAMMVLVVGGVGFPAVQQTMAAVLGESLPYDTAAAVQRLGLGIFAGLIIGLTVRQLTRRYWFQPLETHLRSISQWLCSAEVAATGRELDHLMPLWHGRRAAQITETDRSKISL